MSQKLCLYLYVWVLCLTPVSSVWPNEVFENYDTKLQSIKVRFQVEEQLIDMNDTRMSKEILLLLWIAVTHNWLEKSTSWLLSPQCMRGDTSRTKIDTYSNKASTFDGQGQQHITVDIQSKCWGGTKTWPATSALCTILTILLTLWNSEQKNRLLINKTFLFFIKIRWKTKKFY